jgi:hypothetical protein
VAEMDALFAVQVDYEQEFNADIDSNNRTVSSMLKDMRADLKETTQPFLTFYHLVGGVLGLTWILVIYKCVLILTFVSVTLIISH